MFNILSYYSLTVQYKKEKYTFLDTKAIRSSGGIFSEKEVELNIRNITHIKMKLPYLENKFYKTGRINIESAGAGLTEVPLSSIDNPEKFYEYIESLMKQNGFRLTKSKLVQQETPSHLGAFLESFTPLGVLLIIIFAFGILLTVSKWALSDPSSLMVAYTVMFLILLGVFVKSIAHYLDLIRRTYDLYEDIITYKGGFLSKVYSFIPIENLSDSSLNQTLVDKIFDLYDVTISCQGTQQEIHFKNITNGPKLETNIDNLVNKTESLIGKIKQMRQVRVDSQTYKEHSTPRDTTATAEFKMNMERTVAPILFLCPLIIVAPIVNIVALIVIIALIEAVMRVSATKYLVKPSSMESRYNLFNQKNTEFTNEKITGIVFKENFFDKWFKTCSIHFWSIGSSQNIVFSNIKKTPDLEKMITSKVGIKSDQKLYQMNSNFSIGTMLKANLKLISASVIVLICLFFVSQYVGDWRLLPSLFGSPSIVSIPLVIIIVGFIIALIYKPMFYVRSNLTMFKNHVYFEKGILFKSRYYSSYDSIKDIETIKYPFSERGSIKFNVAGEYSQQQNGNRRHRPVSNYFKTDYIDGIETKDELIDLIFYQRPSPQQIAEIEKNISGYMQKPVIVSFPDAVNHLFWLILGSIIIFPLAVLLPLTIPLVIWKNRVKSYVIQPYRILSHSGILYKKQISIVFNKVDYINLKQGLTNKMFKNGSVIINTTGSSKAELKITNLKDYKNFYDILKQHY